MDDITNTQSLPSPQSLESVKWVVAFQPLNEYGPCAKITSSLMGVVNIDMKYGHTARLLSTGAFEQGQPIRWAKGRDELRSCLEEAFPRPLNVIAI